MFFLRNQLRSAFVILAVSMSIGIAYETLTSGRLTFWGPLIGLLLGVPLVMFEVFFPITFMRRWPFVATVLTKAIIYLSLILLVFLGTTFADGLAQGRTLQDFSAAIWRSETVTKVAITFCLFVVIIFFQQLNRLLGPGCMIRYMFGRYHRPRHEERIFMFLDLKDSTAIAERLDTETYYEFLNDFFHDIAEPVLATKARIYQYVGDEVVLTWTMIQGVEESNCIRVYFGIEEAVRRRRQYYLSRYGLVPEFKAGLHGGVAISAEIGDLKRDLVFSGDVLNTTARIQAECNRLNARLLVSSVLYDRLALPQGVRAEGLGEVELRGKKNAINLMSLAYMGTPTVQYS